MKTNETSIPYLHRNQKQEQMLDNLRIGIIGKREVVQPLMKQAVLAGLDIVAMGAAGDDKPALHSAGFTAGDPSMYREVVGFGKDKDMLTVADESVDVNALRALSEAGVMIFPNPGTVELIQDKCLQKQRLASCNIPVVKGWVVEAASEPMRNEDNRQDGAAWYTTADRQAVWLKPDTLEHVASGADDCYLVQARMEVKRQLTVIVSRNRSGVVECFEPILAVFDGGRIMADYSLCPASHSREVAMSACMLAARAADAIDLAGTICVELIMTGSGKMYVNDLTLRAWHNETTCLESDAITKLERQLRAVLELGASGGNSRLPALTDIPELQAHKKFVLIEALKAVLCTNDCFAQTGHGVGRRLAFPATELQLDELISKTVIVKSLLGSNL